MGFFFFFIEWIFVYSLGLMYQNLVNFVGLLIQVLVKLFICLVGFYG